MSARRDLVHDLVDVRIAYDVLGEGPNVVIIHGWACQRSDMDGMVADLARDHRVLTLDMPWHGGSTTSRATWTMPDLGSLVDAVVAGEGMRDAALVGHSMGAAVAVETVLAGTGHRVISLDGLTFMHMYPRQSPADADAYLAPFRDDFPAAIRALCERASGPDCSPELLDVVATRMGSVDADAAIAMMRELLLWDMDGALARANALGLGVTAFAAESLLSPRAVEAYGHRFPIIPVDLGGHFFPLEHPVKTAGLIREALAA